MPKPDADGAIPNADGAANSDGECVKAPTLFAFGCLAQIAAIPIRRSGCSGTRSVLQSRSVEMYIGIGTVVVIILILILLRVFGIF
jgi:hypothetical protein